MAGLLPFVFLLTGELLGGLLVVLGRLRFLMQLVLVLGVRVPRLPGKVEGVLLVPQLRRVPCQSVPVLVPLVPLVPLVG